MPNEEIQSALDKQELKMIQRLDYHTMESEEYKEIVNMISKFESVKTDRINALSGSGTGIDKTKVIVASISAGVMVLMLVFETSHVITSRIGSFISKI
jgi:hypothetical protein